MTGGESTISSHRSSSQACQYFVKQEGIQMFYKNTNLLKPLTMPEDSTCPSSRQSFSGHNMGLLIFHIRPGVQLAFQAKANLHSTHKGNPVCLLFKWTLVFHNSSSRVATLSSSARSTRSREWPQLVCFPQLTCQNTRSQSSRLSC